MTETLAIRAAALKMFHVKHSGSNTDRIFQAPGRVNLLGEHTDYSGGFCMPAALSFNTLVAAAPRPDRRLRLHSMDFDETVEIALPVELDDVHARSPAGHWSAYPAGVAWSLAQAGNPIVGAELSFSGNVPLGAGLSSSASIEVATATALLALAGVQVDKPAIALACQRAENVYVGAPCGIMDQFISACGVQGNALAIDTRALTSELAPIPDTLRLVIANSMVRHSVGGGEYGERRRQVEEAARALGARNPAVRQLRDATLEELNAAEHAMSGTAFLRARHVVTDSQRVLKGVQLLRTGDSQAFGALMTEAHASFRDDFGASCPECDLLVELALRLDGCLGSRLTGGGFGGCTVSLVQASQAEAFAAELAEQYRRQTGTTAEVFLSETANGAGEITGH